MRHVGVRDQNGVHLGNDPAMVILSTASESKILRLLQMRSLFQGLELVLVKPVIPAAVQQDAQLVNLQQAADWIVFVCAVQRRE